MGATNVAKVFAHWRHLKHREARALLFMANMSLDADNPPVYFGGWVAVAEALGLDPDGKRASASEVFRTTLAALVKAGAVVSSGQARQGVRAEYALALDPNITFVPADQGRSGSGRGVSWSEVPRESVASPSRIGDKSDTCPNESLPHLPQQNVAPHPNESLPHLPQRFIGNSPNNSLPPMRTEEPQGGIQEEIQGETTQSSRSELNGTRARARENDGLKKLSREEERNRQLDALEKLDPTLATRRKAS